MRSDAIGSNKWPQAQQDRLRELQTAGAKVCYWRSTAGGRPCNGGSGPPVSVGTVTLIPGPLELCGSGALHATLIPPKWKGERVWIVALIGEVIGDDEKYGALEREILGEAI